MNWAISASTPSRSTPSSSLWMNDTLASLPSSPRILITPSGTTSFGENPWWMPCLTGSSITVSRSVYPAPLLGCPMLPKTEPRDCVGIFLLPPTNCVPWLTLGDQSPRPPGVYRFLGDCWTNRRESQGRAVVTLPAYATRCGAQVALQRCPI